MNSAPRGSSLPDALQLKKVPPSFLLFSRCQKVSEALGISLAQLVLCERYRCKVAPKS